MQKDGVVPEVWRLKSLPLSQTNGLDHERIDPRGVGGWEAQEVRQKELQTGQREEARCQLFNQLEDAGSCGNGAQSEK